MASSSRAGGEARKEGWLRVEVRIRDRAPYSKLRLTVLVVDDQSDLAAVRSRRTFEADICHPPPLSDFWGPIPFSISVNDAGW